MSKEFKEYPILGNLKLLACPGSQIIKMPEALKSLGLALVRYILHW
jgi:hypothetical protein